VILRKDRWNTRKAFSCRWNNRKVYSDDWSWRKQWNENEAAAKSTCDWCEARCELKVRLALSLCRAASTANSCLQHHSSSSSSSSSRLFTSKNSQELLQRSHLLHGSRSHSRKDQCVRDWQYTVKLYLWTIFNEHFLNACSGQCVWCDLDESGVTKIDVCSCLNGYFSGLRGLARGSIETFSEETSEDCCRGIFYRPEALPATKPTESKQRTWHLSTRFKHVSVECGPNGQRDMQP